MGDQLGAGNKAFFHQPQRALPRRPPLANPARNLQLVVGDLFKIDFHRRPREPHLHIASPLAHQFQRQPHRRRHPGALDHYVGAVAPGQLAHPLDGIMGFDVDGVVDAQFPGDPEPLLVALGATENNRAALGLGDQGRKKSDRTRAGNRDKIAGGDARLFDDRMHAAGQEFRQRSGLKADARGQFVNEGSVAIGGETAIVIVAHHLAVGAEVVVLAQAEVALATDIDARLAGNAVADLDLVADCRPLVHDHPAKLVPHDHRRLDIVVDGVAIDMQVGATDPGGLDFDLDLVPVSE